MFELIKLTFKIIIVVVEQTLHDLSGFIQHSQSAIIADITDPDIIQKILDHIKAQPPPLKRATATQSQNML